MSTTCMTEVRTSTTCKPTACMPTAHMPTTCTVEVCTPAAIIPVASLLTAYISVARISEACTLMYSIFTCQVHQQEVNLQHIYLGCRSTCNRHMFTSCNIKSWL